MTNILLHGLGQDQNSWKQTSLLLKEQGINVLCPNLFTLVEHDRKEYQNLYEAFSRFCDAKKGPLNLCGLSLGGLLALHYTKEHPDKVNSLIIIGTPYKIPKFLFSLQTTMFHLMPQKLFQPCLKQDVITLVSSMKHLNISKQLHQITCDTLILCGEKDRINLKSVEQLKHHIKKSQFQIIKNASHEVNLDNPLLLAQLISHFWTQ